MKIKKLVLDASVLLKAILNEEDSPKVEKIITMKDNFELFILVPDIFRYEFLQQMTRKVGLEAANFAYHAITEFQLGVIPLENDIIDEAQKIMEQHPQVSFYDATYHALAKAYKTDFITADERYYQQTKTIGNIKLLKNFRI